MRTKEACTTRLSFIIAMIVAAAIAVWLPAIPAHALTGSVPARALVRNTPRDTPHPHTPPAPPRPVTARGVTCNFGSPTPTTVTLPASCGGVTISARPGTAAAQAAAFVSSRSQNPVVIRDALIKNTTPARLTVRITANHTFSSTVVASTAQRAYGIGLNASFARKNSSNIAGLDSGNAITHMQ